MPRRTTSRVLPLLIVSALASVGLAGPSTAQFPAEADARAALATGGMVSSAHPLATAVGVAVLEEGGNAFDAAVAVAAALNVVEPMMSGVGGYGTILVYDARRRRARFLNASGRIPVGVDPEAYRPSTPGYRANRRGAKAVSTPGNANAWEAMWRAYGDLRWSELFRPAIRLAQDGFEVDGRTARLIAAAWDDFPDHARSFYGRDGRPLRAGETLVQRDLGRSLRHIAREGARALHGGRLGRAVDEAMRRAGGFLRLEGLERNEAEWWDPIAVDYRGYRVLTASPPANAFPALVRLGMMNTFDVQALGHNTVPFLHRYAEVTKHAFWTRLRWAGDPEVAPPPLSRLLSSSYLEAQANRIDPARAAAFRPPTRFGSDPDDTIRDARAPLPDDRRHPAPPGRSPPVPFTVALDAATAHTTHFVVADRRGNVVSATQTLGNSFGSRIMPEGTGIWLNNSLAYCTFEPPGNPMDAHPGRRKLSGDVPLFVMRDGHPWLAIGTPGGHTIAQTIPQIVMNMVDFGMDVQEAIAAPRTSFVEPHWLAVERTIPETVRDSLTELGHRVRPVDALGNAHGLMIEYDRYGRPVLFVGGADPRGTGSAAGPPGRRR